MFLGFSPLYFILLGPPMLLSLWASFRVKSVFAKYNKMLTNSNLTGAEIATSILRDYNIKDVKVEFTEGNLSDHYDPKNKVLRLSNDVYHGKSMAAFGVAAHEVGHAIQDYESYAPLKIRAGLVPLLSFGQPLSIWIIMGSMLLGGATSVLGTQLAWVGLSLFGLGTLFTLVTLPVEFDASKRALIALKKGAYASTNEIKGAESVLNAAALTYVAAAVMALMNILYYAIQLGLIGGGNRSDE